MENLLKNRIRELMKREQMNPASFAKAIQVNPSAISHILNDRNKPSTEILTKILMHFGTLNSEWLILGTGTMYKTDNQEVSEPQDSSPNETIYENQQQTAKSNPAYALQLDFEASQPHQEPVTPTPTVIEKEVIREVHIAAPERKLQKIIAYYSDNSFEEFSPTEK
ncbi:MAG: helix-turn-helix transcriptional regulator [Prevotellaceae bacterium]|jgi:plasmid maintenance system antidote protein VapI|nr:helix-turn-helix transcriptional regulator [Prevotellaceae bacterium]